jgi:HAD superfamily hydrolase (TIGR01549 family)
VDTKIVLWDFDGVILDSFRMVYDISQSALPELTEDDYRSRFEGNINTSVKELGSRQVDFFAEYTKRVITTELVPGVAEVIKQFSNTYAQIIVSSTITPAISSTLARHNVQSYFKEVLGNDVSPSKTEKCRMVLEKYGVTAKDCVFVTDTLGDIREASEVKIPTIAVTWGYHDRATLEKGNPTAIVEQPSQIPAAIQSILVS